VIVGSDRGVVGVGDGVGGQHENGRREAPAPPALEQIEAILVRQSRVEEEDIEVSGCYLEIGLRAVVDDGDGVAFLFQSLTESPGEVSVLFDQEHAQGSPLVRVPPPGAAVGLRMQAVTLPAPGTRWVSGASVACGAGRAHPWACPTLPRDCPCRSGVAECGRK
jgi:hypothetical protein